LWFGWFGFNGGSALAADGVAGTAFIATHMGGMAGMAMWTIVEWWHRGKPTTLGAASGAVAGLATITPAAGFVTAPSAILIGLIAGAACYLGVLAKSRLGYDDSLDVVGIHGLGGLTGTLLAGLFATKAVNPNGIDGLFYGNAAQFGVQAMGVAVVGAYALVASWLLLKLVDKTMGLRLAPDAESQGMDQAEYTETAYSDSLDAGARR
jgi:Amt family ammonium transporter